MSENKSDKPKRQRGDDDGDKSDDEAFLSKSDLDKILAGYKYDIVQSTSSMLESNARSIQTDNARALATVMRQVDAGYQRRFEKIEGDVSELREGHGHIEADHRKMWQQIESIQKAIAVGDDQPTREILRQEAFDCLPDPSILRLNTADLAGLAAMQEIVKDVLKDSFSPDQYEVSGKDNPGKKFTVKFKGPNEITAARRAEKALCLLRGHPGNWIRRTIKNPSGTYGNIFISENKSRKQELTEIGSKKLLDAFKHYHSDQVWFRSRAEGTVTKNWVSFAKVIPQADETYVIQWNNAAPGIEHIRKEDIAARFRSNNEKAKEQWSI